MKTPEGPTWLPIARRLLGAGVPFLPFTAGGAVPRGNACLPFYLYPEHRDLPHWTAVNDPGAYAGVGLPDPPATPRRH